MSFRVAIRGIPNFSHLQFEEFGSFAEVYARHTVRIRRSVFEHRTEIFNRDGKRVILYILPEEHTPETLRDVCGDYRLSMSPSRSDRARLGMSGTGTAGPGAWQALNPEAFPDYAERLEEYRAACKRAALAQQAADEREEAEAEAEEMARALSDAIDAKGRDEVLKTLRIMGA